MSNDARVPDVTTAHLGVGGVVPPAVDMLDLSAPAGLTEPASESLRGLTSTVRPPAGTENPFEDDELVGTTLADTYRIVRVLGEGGMGRVYEARHTRITAKRFAVKTLHAEYLRQPEVLSRFQREVEAAASLDSPHVVGVYDVARTEDGRPFMVSEFLDGQELGKLIEERGPLPIGFTVRLVRQVCRALGAAHERGIVHRDVKPANIFLVGNAAAPTAKIIDFGISRVAGAGGTALTKTGMIMGTPAFMAPEQAKGTELDHRADVYALGAVLYCALTGSEPFKTDDPQAALVSVLTREPERPRSLVPAIPEHLELIIQKAMAKEPSRRYQDMAALHDALGPYDAGEPEGMASASGAWGAAATSPDVGQAPALKGGTISGQALGVSLARSELVAWCVVGAFWVVALLVSSVGAVLRLVRPERPVSGMEAVLTLVAVCCVLLSPALLSLRVIKRRYWHDSAKVVELVAQARVPLGAALAAYGLLGLLLRLSDTMLLRRPAGVAWAGWDLLLAALSAALVPLALSLRRLRTGGGELGKAKARYLAVTGGALGLAVVATLGAFLARPAGAGGTEGVLRRPDASGSTPAGEGSASAAADAEARAEASTVELESAKAAGLQGLELLSAQYPKDPVVLGALAIEYSRRRDGAPKALELTEKLLAMAPGKAEDEAIGRMLVRLVDGPADVSNKALELLAYKMGKRGPDFLYELWVADGHRAKDAQALLAKPAVRENVTPALGIAIDLRNAKGCKEKKALLERAAALGDQRAADVLQPLVGGASKGCGLFGLSACPAPCQAEAADMKKAIAAIRESRKR